MQQRWIALALLLLLVTFFLAFRTNRRTPEEGKRQGHTLPAKSTQALDSAQRARATKSGNQLTTPDPRITASPNFPERKEHTADALGNFYLPALDLNNVTLAEAVAELLQAYSDICAHTNEAPLNLLVELPEGVDKRVDFQFRERSFYSALVSIASAFETTFDLDDTNLTFIPFSKQEITSPDQIVSRQWAVSPVMQSELQSLLETNDLEKGTRDAQPLETLFTRLGLSNSEASTVSFNEQRTPVHPFPLRKNKLAAHD